MDKLKRCKGKGIGQDPEGTEMKRRAAVVSEPRRVSATSFQVVSNNVLDSIFSGKWQESATTVREVRFEAYGW